MKKLSWIIGLFALGLSARAQTVAIRITVDTTNVFNISAPARHVQGLQLAWQRDIQTAIQLTNTLPTWPQSVTNEILTRLSSLTTQAIADELKTNQITRFIPPDVWVLLSTAQQTNILGILKPFGQ